MKRIFNESNIYDSVTDGDFTYTIEREQDTDYNPLEDEDGHGVVSDWTSRRKYPSEVIIADDHGTRRYYDIQASIANFTKFGGFTATDGKTLKQVVAEAVERDKDFLERWFSDKVWCDIIRVKVTFKGFTLECDSCLGGVYSDSPDSYIAEIADDLVYSIQERLHRLHA